MVSSGPVGHHPVTNSQLRLVLVQLRRVQPGANTAPFIEVQLIFQYLRESWHEAEPLDVWLMENAEDSEC